MKILNVDIENAGYKEILSKIEGSVFKRKYFSFLNVNAYIILSSLKDSSLQNDLKQFSVLYSDGVGVFWASRFLYGKSGLKERITGTDLYYKIIEFAEKENFKVFFFGGDKKNEDALLKQLNSLRPKLHIGGVIPRDLDSNEEILNQINHSESDILFLGLGTPYQEKWIATLGKKCNIPVQISVGSGIDFLSGAYKRAPRIFRILGLEWLFRLIREPKRLWKRYIFGIPAFMLLIIKQKFNFS